VCKVGKTDPMEGKRKRSCPDNTQRGGSTQIAPNSGSGRLISFRGGITESNSTKREETSREPALRLRTQRNRRLVGKIREGVRRIGLEKVGGPRNWHTPERVSGRHYEVLLIN